MAGTATSCRCSSMVFIGNIPYHASEQELREACEEIGPVVSLTVATGKRKGFAFCEYLDDETAHSACRNLHGHSLRGRELRVGLAEQGGRRREPHQPVGVEDATHAASLVSGSTPRDAVTRYLAGQSREQLREMLDAVESEGAERVEQAKREYRGLATLIEQARILLDMAAPDAAAKRESGRVALAPKLKRLDGGKSVPGFGSR